ncbi:MAG: tetratricopeptide repeat protein, partial [bacterium]|nr:tetratricopeptide repeat protein [bacterium]
MRGLLGVALILLVSCGGEPVGTPQLDLESFGTEFRDRLEPRWRRVQSNPADPDASGELAMLLHAGKNYDTAIEFYHRAVVLDAGEFRWRYLLAAALAETGRHAEAAERSREALALSRDDVPARLLLSRPRPVHVSAKAPAGKEIQFHVSAGSLGSIQRHHDGRVSASYAPPKQRFPGRVVVAATTTERDVVNYATIDLYASPKLKIQSAPKALVRVKLGREVFGPIRTDHTGGAILTVEAGPGIAHAAAVARDEAGFERTSWLPLNPPAFTETLV